MTQKNNSQEKTFDHNKASVADKIALIGELEHGRRHALRAAATVLPADGEITEDVLFYLTLANQLLAFRRSFMQKHFGGTKTEDWCLCKVASSIRQLGYEIFSGDATELKELDSLVDDIWGNTLGVDLSDCKACKDDKEASNT